VDTAASDPPTSGVSIGPFVFQRSGSSRALEPSRGEYPFQHDFRFVARGETFLWELFGGMEEVKNARIFAGIHFRSACDDGQKIGIDVANHVLQNSLQPINQNPGQ
jgi:hypothetical protein